MAAPPKEKCIVCTKTVFAMEKVTVEGVVFHEGCFKCAHCKKKLTPGTYTALEGTYYCKPHYTQLFTSKGNYSEGFGKEKPTAHWAPSTATFSDPTKNEATKKEEKPAASAPKAPGPPPPPPAELFESKTPAPASSNAHADALAAIASGGHQLKHVSREERKRKPVSSVVPAESKPKPANPTSSAKEGFSIKTGTPELKLEGLKWTVKYFTNRQEEPIKIEITDMKQSVTVTDCKNCVIIVSGKLTNISIMNSGSCGIIFDDVIATAEVTRCQKVQVQANGKLAQIIIDKTQGCDIFVQNAAKEVEIVTSLTYGINVNFPGATEEDDMIEFPIPDQFVSVIEKGKLNTAPASHV